MAWASLDSTTLLDGSFTGWSGRTGIRNHLECRAGSAYGLKGHNSPENIFTQEIWTFSVALVTKLLDIPRLEWASKPLSAIDLHFSAGIGMTLRK
ncbi:hypothetical protein [Glutamicibacter nicotianae]|uniref:hypothetical protein n=1 Tax=Glutamicibacter nicotianae TaxID=37929 RepID=UPI001142B081|nr:hypothetical protein [Glutamicibacter nicotianae]